MLSKLIERSLPKKKAHSIVKRERKKILAIVYVYTGWRQVMRTVGTAAS